MKYIVILCDGMSDRPCAQLGGKTPMTLAQKPHMDALARAGETGLCRTVAEGLKPGSDVANLSVLGYDPRECYTGRSPLEAASIGIDLAEDDMAFRCNLVTLSEDEPYAQKRMIDYCADDISTAEADVLMKAVQQELGSDTLRFYTGVSYRHCLVVRHAGETGSFAPPHDILDQVIGDHLPQAPPDDAIIALQKRSVAVLQNHPVNVARIKNGKRPANAIWLWGQGRKPKLQNFAGKFGLEGAMVSAVDLMRGIGKCVGMKVCEVPGATGYIDTDFEGKAKAALDALAGGQDFVYIHVEAPDECGHRGEFELKVRSLELIDSRLIAPLLEGLNAIGEDYKIMILPDHATPLELRTHVNDPVPFLIFQHAAGDASSLPLLKGECPAGQGGFCDECFDEESAKAAGLFIDHGPDLMKRFLS